MSVSRPTSPHRQNLSNLVKARNGVWAFCKGFADSLRGAVELFFLDYRASQQREKKLVQRDIDRELILNRESPSREIQNIAKKRALERREQERIKGQTSGGSGEKKEPRILERTLKCMLLNGCVFWSSILIFENVVLPLVQWILSWILRGERADAVWLYTQPILSMAFSTLWVLPFYLLSKIVNAIWFQDIADLAFRSSKGRPVATLSISVMISDTVFTIVVEMIFLVQGSLASLLPIKILGSALNLLHLCLLHSLYSFEYKWFSQGLSLHKRLAFVETNWPYFLGFGLPLAVFTSMPENTVVSGCVFSILFPLFIVSGNQASIVPSPGIPPLNIFAPTINISNAVFSKTITRSTPTPRTSAQGGSYNNPQPLRYR